MRITPSLPPLLLALLLALPFSLAQSSGCAEDCSSCGWFCNQGCGALLNGTECARCLYCRRESSSCAFINVGGSPAEETCEACAEGCWCYGDWYCADDGGVPTPSPSDGGGGGGGGGASSTSAAVMGRATPA